MTKKKSDKKESLNYLYYTGIGFQMLATIGLFTFIGFKIDAYKGNPPSIITGGFSLLGVCISMYSIIKSLTKRSD